MLQIVKLPNEKFDQLKEQLYNLKFETKRGIFAIDSFFGFTLYETFDNDFYLLQIVAAKESVTDEQVSMYKHTFKLLKSIVGSDKTQKLFIKDMTIYPENFGETVLQAL